SLSWRPAAGTYLLPPLDFALRLFLLLDRLLDRLHEVSALLVRRQLGGVLVGFLPLRVVVDGHPLVGVIEDAPTHFHADHLGRPRARLGLGLGLLGGRLLLLGRRFFVLFLCLILVAVAGLLTGFGFFLVLVVAFFLFVHVFVILLAPLGGLEVGTQVFP